MATVVLYRDFKQRQLNGNAINLVDTDEVMVALVTDAYTPSVTGDTTWAGISANEVSGTNYTSGGQAVGTPTVGTSGNNATFDHDTVTWSQSGTGFADARYAVWYGVTSGRLICYLDLGADSNNVGDDFAIALSTVLFTSA